MLLHGAFPLDERVKREADALIARGYEVDVICLREAPGELAEESVDGVRVIRVPLGRTRSHGRLSYLVDYAASAIAFLVRLTWEHTKRRYDLVQVHTLPDSLAFSALPARLLGARLLLDIHDLMPELYASKYGLSEDGTAIRLLRVTERLAVGISDQVVTASEMFRDRLVERGVPSEKVTVVLNTTDTAVFPRPEGLKLPGQGEDYVVFWHGTMVHRYGVDLALSACALARQRVPNLRFVIYGFGECEPDLRALADELGVSDAVEFRGHLAHSQLAARVAEADVGIVPNRPDGHIDMAYPTKLFEFVQSGVPVVATRTQVLERRFGEDSLVFCAPDPDSLADGLVWVYEHPDQARQRAVRALEVCDLISWERMSAEYISAVSSAIGQPPPSPEIEFSQL